MSGVGEGCLDSDIGYHVCWGTGEDKYCVDSSFIIPSIIVTLGAAHGCPHGCKAAPLNDMIEICMSCERIPDCPLLFGQIQPDSRPAASSAEMLCTEQEGGVYKI